MCYKGKNNYLYTWKLVLASLFLLTVIVGCDSLLPEKLQEKEYEAAELDQNACYWLSLPDTLYDSLADRVQARTLQSCLAGTDTMWLDSADNKIIYANFDHLTDSLKTLERNSLLLIGYPADQDTVYTVLNVTAGQAASTNLYLSLEYYYDTENETYTTNVNEYVTVELLKQDSTRVSSAIDLQGETLSGCSKEVIIAQYARIIPIVKERYKFQLAEGAYIVRYILTNPVNIAAFVKGTNRRDYFFKVVIL
jgi:hypothetical protein